MYASKSENHLYGGTKMRKYNLIVLTIFIGMIFGISIIQAGDMDKKAVQGAMDNFIRGKLAAQGGFYEIKGIKTEFDYLHSGVKDKDGSFISCADFKAGNDVYDGDYYVRKIDGKYLVVKELFHKMNGKKVNAVLWTQD
jgi:hypothetical protein